MRIKPLLTFLALTVMLAAAACVPATPVIPRDDTGAGGGTPDASQGSGDSIPQTGGQVGMEEQVRNQVSQFLTQQFNAASQSIESITLTEAEWPDSCLGMGGPAESCAQVITPGWRVSAVVNGQEYALRTNQDASVVRLDMGGSQGAGAGQGTGTQVPGGAGGDDGTGAGGQGAGTQVPGGAGGDDGTGTGTGTGGNQGGSGTGAGGSQGGQMTGTQTPGGTGGDDGTGGNQDGTGTGTGVNQGGTGTGGNQGGAGTAQGGPGDEQEVGGDDTQGTGNTAESGLDVGSGSAGGGQQSGGQQGGQASGGGVPPSSTGEVMLFLIRENDNGQSGQRFGTCGDSLVGVPANVQLSQDGDLAGNLRQVYNALFNLDQQTGVDQGLSTVFQDSNLRLESVSVNQNGRAVVRLFGDLRIDNQCDPDRVRYQLEQAARQFNGINNVQIFVNDQPLEDALPDSASEPDQQQD